MNCRITRVPPKMKGGQKLVSTGNARVYQFDNCEILISYATPVAVKLTGDFAAEGVFVPRGEYRTSTRWSQTTACHLGRWGMGNAEEVPQYVLDTIYETVRRN